MVINGISLFKLAPLKLMESVKKRIFGTSYGLSEAGYDIRIAQKITFYPPDTMRFMQLSKNAGSMPYDYYKKELQKAHLGWTETTFKDGQQETNIGRFVLASAIEEFQMPPTVVATVKDKSTWARQGLSVFNTVAEPKWNGFLTLELVFHGNEVVYIEAGSGIAQVLFDSLSEEGDYADGKYQNQENRPVEARS